MDLESRLPWWLARLLPRRRRLKVAVARQRGKNRSGTFTILTFGAAATAFVLAFVGVGPFAVQAIVVNLASGQIPASAAFPVPSPTTKTVIVYDPPRAAPSTSNPRPAPAPSSRPNPSPQPTPTEPGDN